MSNHLEEGDEVVLERDGVLQIGIVVEQTCRFAAYRGKQTCVMYLVMFDDSEFPTRLTEWDGLKKFSLLEKLAFASQ